MGMLYGSLMRRTWVKVEHILALEKKMPFYLLSNEDNSEKAH